MGNIGNSPAQSLTYLSQNSSGVTVKTQIIFAVNNSKLYAMIFAAPEVEAAFLKSADPVFLSFAFISHAA